jgi:23S rRNA (uracil1939-C5)-methyltransferase
MTTVVQPGARLNLTCVDVDEEGAGLCPFPDGGGLVHVRGALPGEEVTATVEHVSPHRPEAWVTDGEITLVSPERREPVCPGYGPCGGCVLQHWDPAAQLAWKSARVAAALAAYPGLTGVPVAAAVASPHNLGYRNNAKLVCGRADDGTLVLGAFASRSHDVIDLAGCRIVEEPLDQVASSLREQLNAAGVVPYDEQRLIGDLRYVVLRSNHAGQVLVTLVTTRREWAPAASLAAALQVRHPSVVGVVQNLNPTRGNAILGPGELTLAGASFLREEIGGVQLRLSSRAFFQANRGVTALAYAAIADAVATHAPGGEVVDAYCGVGGIALTVASRARQVLGIETNADAVADAQGAAVDGGIQHVRFVVADSADGLRAVPRADAIILNPPRKGCAPAVLAEVLRLAPAVIAYLSCAPDTLARDLAVLTAAGRMVKAVTPYDMLPHTAHIEALAVVI